LLNNVDKMTARVFDYPYKRSFFVACHKLLKKLKNQLITMEQSNALSTKGKGLGLAGMIIGIVAILWAPWPLIGGGAIWLALPGTILSVIAMIMASKGNNPNKGVIITGLILNVVALILAIYRMYELMAAVGTGMDNLQNYADSLKNVH
jgi:hypothetical protein